jgi:dienelactone hydrolase
MLGVRLVGTLYRGEGAALVGCRPRAAGPDPRLLPSVGAGRDRADACNERPRMTTVRNARSIHVAGALVCAVAVLAAACGGGDSDYEVTSSVVSHETTQDILVFEPQAEGSWPVVFVWHGIDGSGEDMTEIATRLAREGHVVFVPTYRSDVTTNEGLLETVVDFECGYRFARSIAAEHGGDLDEPVTFVGWSMGATLALQGGLTEEIDPSGEVVSCFTEVPPADVIVAISGCHYDFDFDEGAVVDFFDPTSWGNEDAHVVLIAGDADTNCPPRHSEDAAAELSSAGYDSELVMLQGTDHFAPVFHDFVDGKMIAANDDPAGEKTVEVTLDAIAAQDRT